MVTKQFSTSSLLDEGIKYLKVRTLIELAPLKQSTSLAKFLQKYKIELTDVNRDTAKQIRRMLYDNTAVSGNALDQVIRSVHQELFTLNNYDNLKTSLKEVAKSSEYIKGWNGVFRDDIRAHIQRHYVRNPSILDLEVLKKKISEEMPPILTGYTVMSWYNQWTSTIIENIFMNHPNVVPTIRKIKDVDFFFLNIPVDLKVTFLPKEYVKKRKKLWRLKTDKEVVERFMSDMLDLGKWLYENQGENRFSDNHRIFIVLMDEGNLEDSWKLKSDFDLIDSKVNEYLSSTRSLSKLNWSFDGKGNFTTLTGIIPIAKVT